VRHRYYLVEEVIPGTTVAGGPPVHRVRLRPIDDEVGSRPLDVIWERELHARLHDKGGLPDPRKAGWDPPARFEAFLHATRWTLCSVLDGLPLQAPFRANIRIEDYQLEPLVRALRMPRISLLIADDVGLGKTIEAGLVLQELIARQRVRRVLIVCPASLQRQWADEMSNRFALEFKIVDRSYIHQVRKEYGVHVNPWSSYPRLITSMDFLKREGPLRYFRASPGASRRGGLRDWDLLIVDEAHNMAPAGRGGGLRDSDRTRMLREIKDYFEHRLFLTATPHNGYTESFLALLEILDPLRFNRGLPLNREQLRTVMVRRLKDDIVGPLGKPVFPSREVVAIPVTLEGDDRRLLELLDGYIAHRLERLDSRREFPIRFALLLLKRRLLSSPLAFRHSLAVHREHLRRTDGEEPPNERVVRGLRARVNEDHDDDDEKDQAEETALAETARYFPVDARGLELVEEMQALAERAARSADSKARTLLRWIEERLAPDRGWNRERLLVFTEYRDTLVYLRGLLLARGWPEERILVLHGNMRGSEREAVKAAFRRDPEEPGGEVRILIATDAAAEGLNLQEHCRLLIHYDLPWNPNRMEQRNGRIDRHGQPARKVFCHHFHFTGREDSRFLHTVAEKVKRMREDLGAVGEVIAAQVEEAMLGRRTRFQVPRGPVAAVRQYVRAESMDREQIRALQRAWRQAQRELRINRETMRRVVEEALRVEGRGELLPVEEGPLAGKAWRVRNLPDWPEVRASLLDREGRRLKIVFEEADARGRRDVTLLHLDHPLMKRALGVFRANMWAMGLHSSHRLHRILNHAPWSRVDAPKTRSGISEAMFGRDVGCLLRARC
jgi:superfamily II DNA or RNA helicase